MADNYQQFSEMIQNTTPEERVWFRHLVFVNEDDVLPEGLDLNEEETERLSWAFDFSHDGDGTWIRTEESGDIELLGKVICCFIKKFRPDYTFRLTWADTCSKLRVGEFGGGALVVDKDGWACVSAYDLAELSSKQLKEITEKWISP